MSLNPDVLQQQITAIAQGIMLIIGAIIAIWSKSGVRK